MRNRLKIYVILLGLALLLSLGGMILIIKYLDPYSSASNVILFYLDGLVLVGSLATLAGFEVRQRFGQRELANQYFRISLRQAVWLSILTVGSLLLRSLDLFNFLNAIVLILAFIFLESYFLITTNK